jgi:two-component system, OmpR family, response regulator RpaB
MTRPKIVIVDNNHEVCRIYEDTLNSAGYDAIAVCEEEKALEVISKELPQLVLLDILMPKISGLHILDMICKNHHTRNVEVIIFTEVADSNIKKNAMDHGAKDYIIKSETNMKELLKRIDKVLSR